MDATYQAYQSDTFYSPVIQQPLSNSEPQFFRTILGNCSVPFTPGHCPVHKERNLWQIVLQHLWRGWRRKNRHF